MIARFFLVLWLGGGALLGLLTYGPRISLPLAIPVGLVFVVMLLVRICDGTQG